MKTIAGLTLAAALIAGQEGIELDLRNKENIVSSRLEGEWRTSGPVDLHLNGAGGKDVMIEGGGRTRNITFQYDPKAVPEEALKKIAGRSKVKFTVYAMGTMTLNDQKRPFLVAAINGNPHVIFFCERGGDAFGNAESFNVMLAAGKAPENDLLFIGGDFNNQPFHAFERGK